MSIRRETKEGLTAFQRLALFNACSNINAERALSLRENEITFQLLVENSVNSISVGTAGIRPSQLKQMGAQSASELRRLGFSSLNLSDPEFAMDICSCFGAEDVIESFLVSASDAVMIAGTEAQSTLGITPQQLLEACAGAPCEASETLKQLPHGSLKGVDIKTVLDAGLRAPQLKNLGYGIQVLSQLVGGGERNAAKLGFTL